MSPFLVSALELRDAPVPERPNASSGRRKLAVVAALAVVLIGGLLLYPAVTKVPLSSHYADFPDSHRVENPAATDGFAVEVVYSHGAPYAFSFTVHNNSVFPVEIVRFPSQTWGGLLMPVSVAVDGSEARPMRQSFTIGPRRTATLEVRTRFGNCQAFGPDSGATLLAIPVRYRVLWFTRTDFIELPGGLQVNAPDSCPGTAWE
jgi:hypothetical protein